MYIYRKKKSREGGSVMKIFYPSVLSAAMAVTLLCSCCKEDPLRGLPLGMIGIEEPVAIEPFKTPFPAKIDTGADVASIDAENIKLVKRGEENIVVFTIRQRGTGEEHQYELPLKRRISIVRHGRKPQQRHKKRDSYNSYEQILFCFWFHEKNPFPELMAEICKENVCELFFVL